MSSQPPPFENADKCRKCNTGFSLFTRKHHCRQCGKTFCGDHSAGSIPLPHFGLNEPVRVCAECEQNVRAGMYNKKAAAPASSFSSSVVTSKPSVAAETKEETFVASPPPPAKKVSNCTCNSPLCICAPDPEEKPVEATKSSSNNAPTRKAAPVSSSTSSSSTPSTFMGFGGVKQKQVWNLKGDLNEQIREAVKAQDMEGIQQLLGAGADARYVDRTGNSLVHLAAMFNRYDIVELLAKHGADLWVKNPSKETPIDLAPPALQKKMKELQPQKE